MTIRAPVGANNAHKFHCRREKRRASIWPSVQLVIICLKLDPFKDRGSNVFFYKNTRRHYKSPNNNLRTSVEYLDQWIYTPFRPAPRIFTHAPSLRPTPPHPTHPADFYLCPAPPKNPPPCISLQEINPGYFLTKIFQGLSAESSKSSLRHLE